MTRKVYLFVISIIVSSLFIFSGCDKELTASFSVQINLLDQYGVEKNRFEKGDSLIFEFYLSNLSGNSAEYLRPCTEFMDYFNIYRENSSGEYDYFGSPDYYCELTAIYLTINEGEIMLLNRIAWKTKLGWPDILPGKYCVGDILSLSINGEAHDFTGRIYFEILE